MDASGELLGCPTCFEDEDAEVPGLAGGHGIGAECQGKLPVPDRGCRNNGY